MHMQLKTFSCAVLKSAQAWFHVINCSQFCIVHSLCACVHLVFMWLDRARSTSMHVSSHTVFDHVLFVDAHYLCL
jgi:hypothetical protein